MEGAARRVTLVVLVQVIAMVAGVVLKRILEGAMGLAAGVMETREVGTRAIQQLISLSKLFQADVPHILLRRKSLSKDLRKGA